MDLMNIAVDTIIHDVMVAGKNHNSLFCALNIKTHLVLIGNLKQFKGVDPIIVITKAFVRKDFVVPASIYTIKV